MSITVVGLGPAGLDRTDTGTVEILLSGAEVIARTGRHPAVEQLAARIDVMTCDDLYERHDDFDGVYEAIVRRVVDAARSARIVYAVPGSPTVGERTVPLLLVAAGAAGVPVTVRPAASFLDLAFAACGIDPIADGVQILDGRDLPDPLPLHVPSLITQVDSVLQAGDVAVALGRLLDEDATVTILDRLGDPDERVVTASLADLARYEAGIRTTVFVPAAEVGLLGLVATNETLREACPWDREQTHHSLLEHLIEEAYETADAIGHLSPEAPGGPADHGAYAEVEDELGDLLLQVVFHATLAREAGAFTIDDVAEQNRRKLVRRHPHVYGEVEARTAGDVRANWEQIKQTEKDRSSLMDDIPAGMPAVARALKVQKRAASVGFDWPSAEPILDVLRSEIDELEAAGTPKEVAAELGDVLFSSINLARHLDIDPEAALRAAAERFMERFRLLETDLADRGTPVAEADAEAMEAAWTRAKATTMGTTPEST